MFVEQFGGIIMASARRKLGVNIFTLMQKKKISREELADQLGYTYRDICRLTEGCLMLPPIELAKIATKLNTTKEILLHLESDNSVPELQYMKEFSNSDNLDTILDLIDEYVELQESL